MERLWYYHLKVKAELHGLREVLRWVLHRYTRAFAAVTAACHIIYYGLVAGTGYGLYVYPAGVLMVVALLSVISGEEH